jgi:hypothetical protein
MKTFRRLSEESQGRRWRLVTASCFVFWDAWRWRLQAIEPVTLMRVDPARSIACIIGDGNLELESRRKYSGGDRETAGSQGANGPPEEGDPYLTERQWGPVREDYSHHGAGLYASHQTGWAGLVAMAIHLFGMLAPQRTLEIGKMAA